MTNRFAAIGNLIVNHICPIPAASLPLGLSPGSSTLVQRRAWEELASRLEVVKVEPGGTSVNSISALAALGHPCTMVGSVGPDSAAELFRGHFRSLGITLHASVPEANGVTGRCLILVQPSGERTLVTDLGSAGLIDPSALRLLDEGSSCHLMTEVYQWDGTHSDAVFDYCRRWRGPVVLTLSAVSAIERNHTEVTEFIELANPVLIGSREEFAALLGYPESADAAAIANASLSWRRGDPKRSSWYMTDGHSGAYFMGDGQVVFEPAKPHVTVVDLTGAGDYFAAGVLHARQAGFSPSRQLRLGHEMAASVISRLGTLIERPNGGRP